MSIILEEILSNFEDLANQQFELKKEAAKSIDESALGLINSEEQIETFAHYLDNSILVTADDNDILLEKKFPFGLETEDIVTSAHPNPAVMAEGPHSSGVVDNQNEQHEKIVNMVNKMPTGNVFHNFSFAAQLTELTAIAAELDAKGLYEEAFMLDQAAAELVKKKLK